MVKKLLLVFVFLFLSLRLAQAASEEELKQKLLGDLNGFLQSYSKYKFNKAISLGDYNMIQEAMSTGFDIEIDPSLKFTGKYYPGQARVFGKLGVRDDLIVLKDEPGHGANVTLYHEMLHHLINRKKLNPGCLDEETYMQLIEDRITWLKKLTYFEKQCDLAAKESDSNAKNEKLKKYWNDNIESAWKQQKGITYAQNLSGPYEFEDADASCGVSGAKGHIDPDFVKKVDNALGIDVDVNKIRNFYEKEYSIKLSGEEAPAGDESATDKSKDKSLEKEAEEAANAADQEGYAYLMELLRKLKELSDQDVPKDYEGLKAFQRRVFDIMNACLSTRPSVAYDLWLKYGQALLTRISTQAGLTANFSIEQVKGESKEDKLNSQAAIRCLLIQAECSRWANFIGQMMERIPEKIVVVSNMSAGNIQKRKGVWDIAPRDKISQEEAFVNYNGIWKEASSFMLNIARKAKDAAGLRMLLAWFKQYENAKLESNGKSILYLTCYANPCEHFVYFKMLPDSEKAEIDKIIEQIKKELKLMEEKPDSQVAKPVGPCKKMGNAPNIDDMMEELRCTDAAF